MMPIDGTAVDDLFADWQRDDAPGGVLGIIDHGSLVYTATFGMADLERPARLTADSVFDVASVAKQFTAFCIALLAHDGGLTLDDELHDYLPDLPDYGAAITLRHLIHHLSGLPDYLELMELCGLRLENDYSPADVFALLRSHPRLNTLPGERYLYCNTGYFLLAQIVEQVSGHTLGTFAAQRIFEPLGMTRTLFADDPAHLIPGRAVGYSPRGDGYGLTQSLMSLVGDGKLYTTLTDLARWDANFYDNRLGGGADLIRQITTSGRLNDGRLIDYAFGLQLQRYRGLPIVRHGGAWLGYKAEFMRLPDVGVTLVCLANRTDAFPGERCRRVVDRLLTDRLAPLPASPEPTAAPPPAYVPRLGQYADDAGRITWRLTWGDGHLWMHHLSWTRFGLLEQSPDHFIGISGPVGLTLTFREADAHIALEGFAPADLRYLPPFVPVLPSEHTGIYAHDTLGIHHRLRMADGGLEAVIANLPQPVPLTAVAPDVWIAPNSFHYAFQRDAAGAISGVIVSSERVHDLTFRRIST